MNNILTKFLNKSFSKLAPNATVTNQMVAEVIQTTAATQDFLENTAQKLGNKPNADIIFKRIKNSNKDLLKIAFLFILEFMIKQVKYKFNRREWVVAIDTHYEPFYGEYVDLWVHGYRPVKGCKGSYKFITVALVVGEARFTLLALPVMVGEYTEDLVEELIAVAKKYVKIRLVLLDRGFYSGAVISVLDSLKLRYLMFVPNKKKSLLEKTFPFSHRYVYHEIEYCKNKSKYKVKVKLLILKDYLDIVNWKLYDWIFATNLANIDAYDYVKIYKQRWGIETAYRMFGKFTILTTSTNPVARYFFFLVVVLLYNLWKFYNLINEMGITFATFMYSLFLSSIKIEHVEAAKGRLGKPFVFD